MDGRERREGRGETRIGGKDGTESDIWMGGKWRDVDGREVVREGWEGR